VRLYFRQRETSLNNCGRSQIRRRRTLRSKEKAIEAAVSEAAKKKAEEDRQKARAALADVLGVASYPTGVRARRGESYGPKMSIRRMLLRFCSARLSLPSAKRA